MVPPLPNDTFQFSPFHSLTAGHKTGQPTTTALSSHGTHGLGVYEDGTLLLLLASRAFAIEPTSHEARPVGTGRGDGADGEEGDGGKGYREAKLPWVMVTPFQPTSAASPLHLKMSELATLTSSGSGRVNTLVPFLVAASFTVQLASSLVLPSPSSEEPRTENTETKTLTSHGTIFGFLVPEYMRLICGPAVHAYFLSEDGASGGVVVDFEAVSSSSGGGGGSGGVRVEWASCGRFHLGFPRDEKWAGLELGG